jgi:hypothetical protein
MLDRAPPARPGRPAGSARRCGAGHGRDHNEDGVPASACTGGHEPSAVGGARGQGTGAGCTRKGVGERGPQRGLAHAPVARWRHVGQLAHLRDQEVVHEA